MIFAHSLSVDKSLSNEKKRSVWEMLGGGGVGDVNLIDVIFDICLLSFSSSFLLFYTVFTHGTHCMG